MAGWGPGCCWLAGPSKGTKTHFWHKENEGKESHRAHVGTSITFPPSAGEVRASLRCHGHAPARDEGAAPPGSPQPAELKEEEEDGDRETGHPMCWRGMKMMPKPGLWLLSLWLTSWCDEVGGGREEEGLAGGFGAGRCSLLSCWVFFCVVVTTGEV